MNPKSARKRLRWRADQMLERERALREEMMLDFETIAKAAALRDRQARRRRMLGRFARRAALSLVLGLIAAFVVVCLWACAARADNISDLRLLPGTANAASMHWNVNGHPLAWHVAQIKAGHRHLPAILLQQPDNQYNTPKGKPPFWTGPLYRDMPDLESWKYLADNALPLVWRYNNLQDEIYSEASVSRNVGTGQFLDRFAPLDDWAMVGQQFADSPEIAEIKKRLPNAPYFVFIENNESGAEGNKLSKLKLAVAADGKNPLGMGNLAWAADLATKSQRMGEYAAKGKTPFDFLQVDDGPARKAQYAAFYKPLRDSFSVPIFTSAYRGMDYAPNPVLDPSIAGYAPIAYSYDWQGLSAYLYENVDLTSLTGNGLMGAVLNGRPKYRWLQEHVPGFARIFTVYVGPVAAISGKQMGKHELLTPERVQGWALWHAWTLHDKGCPFVFIAYSDSDETPDGLFFENQQDALDAIGSDESKRLKTLTNSDYYQPIANAADLVMSAPLREFWEQGTIVPIGKYPLPPASAKIAPFPATAAEDDRWVILPCDANSSGVYRVWSCAIQLGDRYLIPAFTPCLIDSCTVTVPGVGDFKLDFKGSAHGHWLVERSGYAIRKVN